MNTDLCKGQNTRPITLDYYRCISAAEAASSPLFTSVQSEEGKHSDVEGITHLLVIFIVDLEEKGIRVQFSKLAYLFKYQD